MCNSNRSCFNQRRGCSCGCGERIRVNQGFGVEGRNGCGCQNSRNNGCCPRPCHRCDDRCTDQYRGCMRDCRCRENRDWKCCDDRNDDRCGNRCEDRCADHFRRCMRDCRREDCGCNRSENRLYDNESACEADNGRDCDN